VSTLLNDCSLDEGPTKHLHFGVVEPRCETQPQNSEYNYLPHLTSFPSEQRLLPPPVPASIRLQTTATPREADECSLDLKETPPVLDAKVLPNLVEGGERHFNHLAQDVSHLVVVC